MGQKSLVGLQYCNNLFISFWDPIFLLKKTEELYARIVHFDDNWNESVLLKILKTWFDNI